MSLFYNFGLGSFCWSHHLCFIPAQKKQECILYSAIDKSDYESMYWRRRVADNLLFLATTTRWQTGDRKTPEGTLL